MKYYPLLSEAYSPEAVILANGEYPSHPLPLVLLKQAKYVVCCDGAADEYIQRGFTPNAIIGDGDSLSQENKKRFATIIHTIPDQETNDQTKAIRHCINLGKKKIVIVGATGKREDHTLGNISLIMEYMDEMDVELVTDYGTFTPACEDGTFCSYPGQAVSLFNCGATGIRGEALLYPLRDFTSWWQGTLNQSQDNEFRIYAQGKYLIFRTHPITSSICNGR